VGQDTAARLRAHAFYRADAVRCAATLPSYPRLLRHTTINVTPAGSSAIHFVLFIRVVWTSPSQPFVATPPLYLSHPHPTFPAFTCRVALLFLYVNIFLPLSIAGS